MEKVKRLADERRLESLYINIVFTQGVQRACYFGSSDLAALCLFTKVADSCAKSLIIF